MLLSALQLFYACKCGQCVITYMAFVEHMVEPRSSTEVRSRIRPNAITYAMMIRASNPRRHLSPVLWAFGECELPVRALQLFDQIQQENFFDGMRQQG